MIQTLQFLSKFAQEWYLLSWKQPRMYRCYLEKSMYKKTEFLAYNNRVSGWR